MEDPGNLLKKFKMLGIYRPRIYQDSDENTSSLCNSDSPNSLLCQQRPMYTNCYQYLSDYHHLDLLAIETFFIPLITQLVSI